MKINYFNELDPSRLDKRNGVVFGVAVCTEGPARGHGLTVDSRTLQQLFEAAQDKNDKIPVKLDHSSGIGQVCGYLTNFTIDRDKLRADWHLLKNQSNFSHTWELLENMHDVCGLSCSFTGEGENGKARCRELISCDFVPHPATGNGLFSRGEREDENEDDDMNDEPMTAEEMLRAILEGQDELHDRLDQVEAQQNELLDALDALEDDDSEEEDEDDDDDEEEPLLEERGARRGPQQHSAAYLTSHDFSERVRQLQFSGMNQKVAHIAALKEFARSQNPTTTL